MINGYLKTCQRCGEDKPYSEFTKNCKYKDGHRSICKPCHNGRARELRAGANREHIVTTIPTDPEYYEARKAYAQRVVDRIDSERGDPPRKVVGRPGEQLDVVEKHPS